MTEPQKVKLVVELDDPEGPGAENLWAEHVADTTFRLCNIPTHAYALSSGDVVEARLGEDDRLNVVSVVERGGHSTYRVIPDQAMSKAAFDKRWSQLEKAGCRYESTEGNLRYAIDVPPQADIHAVYQLLEAGEQDGVWEFEEGHCGHPVD